MIMMIPIMIPRWLLPPEAGEEEQQQQREGMAIRDGTIIKIAATAVTTTIKIIIIILTTRIFVRIPILITSTAAIHPTVGVVTPEGAGGHRSTSITLSEGTRNEPPCETTDNRAPGGEV